MHYTIESGIPIPPRLRAPRRGPARRTFLRQALDSLEVGQSFLMKNNNDYTRAMGLLTSLSSRTYTVRKIEHEGWRIWRTE